MQMMQERRLKAPLISVLQNLNELNTICGARLTKVLKAACPMMVEG